MNDTSPAPSSQSLTIHERNNAVIATCKAAAAQYGVNLLVIVGGAREAQPAPASYRQPASTKEHHIVGADHVVSSSDVALNYSAMLLGAVQCWRAAEAMSLDDAAFKAFMATDEGAVAAAYEAGLHNAKRLFDRDDDGSVREEPG